MIHYRELNLSDAWVLEDFLYLALHQENVNRPLPRAAIHQMPLAIYTTDWGRHGDVGVVALTSDPRIGESEVIIGVAWSRILSGDTPGYGNIDDHTPEYAVAVRQEFRRRGVGEELLTRLSSRLAGQGYKQVSLSVQKTNPAHRLYRRLGFDVAVDRQNDWVMLKNLVDH